MKKSVFNNYLTLPKNYSLIYNSLADSFLVYKLDILGEWDALSETHPALFDKLVKGRFFIEDTEDEWETLYAIKRKVDEDLSMYTLIINPTLFCNFYCWYCYETHDSKSIMPQETLETVEKHIQLVCESPKLKQLDLSFFGGEPLLYYNKTVLPLMRFAKDICDARHIALNITFTTNGYLLNESMMVDFANFGVSQLQITLDGYREDHDKTRFPRSGGGSYDHIVGNIKMLLHHQIAVLLRINYTKNNLPNVWQIADTFRDMEDESRSYLKVMFFKVWQEKVIEDSADILSDVMDRFRLLNINASVQLLNNLREPCYADKRNEAVINYNGDVYKCTARDFKRSGRDGYLSEDGSIIWENSQAQRVMAKMRNRLCHQCTIAPLCFGICSQKAIEAPADYCLYPNEKDKQIIILDRFNAYLLEHEDAILSTT